MELPHLISEHRHGDSRLELHFQLEPEQSWFKGHFQGAPVLAGVIQLGWAITFAEQKFERRWNFLGLRSAKFQQLILPPVRLRLDLEYLKEQQVLKFKYSDAAGTYSSGAAAVALRSE